jgi:hypothetical protein
LLTVQYNEYSASSVTQAEFCLPSPIKDSALLTGIGIYCAEYSFEPLISTLKGLGRQGNTNKIWCLCCDCGYAMDNKAFLFCLWSNHLISSVRIHEIMQVILKIDSQILYSY